MRNLFEQHVPDTPPPAKKKPAKPRFGGQTFDAKRDTERLSNQLRRVRDLIRDGRWRTLDQIAGAVHAPAASVSTRLRDLRKPEFGGHAVDRQPIGAGVSVYRLVTDGPPPPLPDAEAILADAAAAAEARAGQLDRIKAVIRDGRWRTLEEIAAQANAPHASVSAQLRNLRKPAMGGWDIEKKSAGRGLYQYRLKMR